MGTPLLAGVDPLLLAAYDREPEDLTLLGAMADCARESGEEVVADALDWVRAKGRVPGWWESAGWSNWLDGKFTDLPFELYYLMPVARAGDHYSDSLLRLLVGWSRVNPEQRRRLWEWNPGTRDWNDTTTSPQPTASP